MVAISFVLFSLALVGVGVAASIKRKANPEDYLLAGRGVHPVLTGLSAVSTNHSGFMFIGLVGFTYTSGVQAVWLMLGWMLGDVVAWSGLNQRVRRYSEQHGVMSLPALLGVYTDEGQPRQDRALVVLAGWLTLIFLCGYAAAQLKAASTALYALFGWPTWIGIVAGGVIVALYCWSGGLRASIWTDAAQAVVMVAAMAALLLGCYHRADLTELGRGLAHADPALLSWQPQGLAFGFLLYLVGFVFGGFGVVGQPHIMVRYMSVKSVEALSTARWVYFLWYAVFSTSAVFVGLYARVLLPDLLTGASPEDVARLTEGAMPALALKLLAPLWVGLMVAGIFSATMSTADSQVLACSAAVTQDIFPRWRLSYRASKVATLVVAVAAMGIALMADDSVFHLVLKSWSILGSAFGPLLILRLLHRPLRPGVSVLVMLAGPLSVFAWDASVYANDIFVLLPGFVTPFVVYAIAQAVERYVLPTPPNP